LVLPSQEARVKALEKKIKSLEETIENLTVSESEALTPNKEENDKARLKPSLPSIATKEAIEVFVEDMTKRFGKSSKPICNAVPRWNKETIFNINSYNKLSILTLENNYKQLENPLEINHFWQWLFNNSHRIGDKIDFSKTPTLKELEKRFLNQTLIIGKKEEKIYEFVPFNDGIKVKVENQEGKVRFIADRSTRKEMVFSFGKCQELLFKLLKFK
jgi:hypothetical protein